jgi:anti-sigma B factor antagonist
MAVTRTAVGTVTVLGVSGEFTGGDETDRLREAILQEAAAGNTRLILDLAGCTMMNSSGMSVLVEAYRNYAARGGTIRLAGLQRRMTSQLSTVRLIEIFGHHVTVDEAVAAFAGRSAQA